MSLQLSLVLACGVIALLYGGWLVQQLLALSPGTKEMQEIASAFRRARAGLSEPSIHHGRDVGAVIFIAAFIVLGWQVAVGFLIGATLSGSAGYVGMNVSVRANVRHCGGLADRPRARSIDGLSSRRRHGSSGGRARPSGVAGLLRHS